MNGWLLELNDATQLLGWVLVHFLWQGAVIGAAYSLLRRLLQPGQPRHALALLTFVALSLSPILTAWYLLQTAAEIDSVALPQISGGVAASLSAAADAPYSWDWLLPWLVAGWAAGVAALTARALLHWRNLSRLMRRATALDSWRERLAQICGQFGIRRAIGLLSSNEIHTPTLVGWIRPVILLPAAVVLGFPAAQIELILAHELGHLRRWDHVVNLLQVVVETILFYHPIVHWVSRELRHEREICCDELVLALGSGDRRDYVRTLADLEELRQHNHGALVLTATGGVLLERVQRIAGVPVAGLSSRIPGRLLPLLIGSIALLAILASQQSRLAPSILVDLLLPRQMHVLLGDGVVAPQRQTLQVANLRPAIPAVPVPVLESTTRNVAELESAPVAALAAPAPSGPLTDVRSTVPDRQSASALTATALVAPLAEVTLPVGDLALAPAPKLAPVATVAPNHVEPVVLRSTQPVYPQYALERGIEGLVELSFTVKSDGSVRDIVIDRESPNNVFNTAAMNAIRRWRFDPSSLPQADARYSRSFVFALTGSTRNVEGDVEEVAAGVECRPVTGTRICRRAGDAQE